MYKLSLSQTQQPKAQQICRKQCLVQANKQPSQQIQKLEKNPLSKISKQVIAGCTLALTALPVLAELSPNELMESLEGPGHLFDFDITLPIVMTEFLLLMVFLDKTWFGPVGKVLDDRDKLIRERLASVKGGGTELEDIQKETEQVMKTAFMESQLVLNAAREEAQKQSAQKIEEAKKVQDKELASALAKLEAEKAAAQGELDKQVEKLSQEILKKILPAEIKVKA